MMIMTASLFLVLRYVQSLDTWIYPFTCNLYSVLYTYNHFYGCGLYYYIQQCLVYYYYGWVTVDVYCYILHSHTDVKCEL